MGEIADQMINGSMCHQCGVYLEPKERVFLVHFEKGTNPQVSMSKDGTEFGIPVYCVDCYKENN